MKSVCFHCADRLPLGGWEKNEDPEPGDVCDHCGHVYERDSEQTGTWRPLTAIERLKEAMDE